MLKTLLNYPKWIVVAIIALTVFFGLQLKNIKFDGTSDGFLPQDHPVRTDLKKMEKQFGSGDMLLIVIEDKKGSFFTEKNLNELIDLTTKLEVLPNVESILSLANAKTIRGTDGGFETENIIAVPKVTAQDIASFKEKLFEWDTYEGILYSDDQKSTQILIELNKEISANEQLDTWNKIKSVVEESKTEGVQFYYAGAPVLQMEISQNLGKDIALLVPFISILLLVVLWLSLQNISAVLLPLITVAITATWTVGLMSLLGFPLKMMTGMVPTLIMAVGSAYGIHVVTHYFDEHEIKSQGDGELIHPDAHSNLIKSLFIRIGRPVVFAGFTTIAGFISLSMTNLIAIREFGIFTSIGVTLSVVVAIFFIPAVLQLLHINKHKNQKPSATKVKKINRVVEHFYTPIFETIHFITTKHKEVVIISSVLFIALSIFGISKLKVGQPLSHQFRETSLMRQADNFVNERFAGTSVVNLVVTGLDNTNAATIESSMSGNATSGFAVSDADFEVSDSDFEVDSGSARSEEIAAEKKDSIVSETTQLVNPKNRNSLKEPLILAEIDKMENYFVNKFPELKKSISISQMIKQMNQVMHKEESTAANSFYEIPIDPKKYGKKDLSELKNLISQYLLLYSGNLDSFYDDVDNPTMTRVMFQLNTGDPKRIDVIVKEIEAYSKKHLHPLGYESYTAGHAKFYVAINQLVISSQISSLLFAILFVFLILSISNRTVQAGLFGTVPLVITTLGFFGVMGYFKIALDVGTALVGSITVGIGIDYAIHYMAGLQNFIKDGKEHEEAMRLTLHTTGKAILFNALSVSLGFLVLMFSQFNPIRNFGLLLAISMFISSFCTLFVLPVFFKMGRPAFIENNPTNGSIKIKNL